MEDPRGDDVGKREDGHGRPLAGPGSNRASLVARRPVRRRFPRQVVAVGRIIKKTPRLWGPRGSLFRLVGGRCTNSPRAGPCTGRVATGGVATTSSCEYTSAHGGWKCPLSLETLAARPPFVKAPRAGSGRAGAGQGSLWNFGVFDIGGVKYKSGQVAAVGFAVDLGL